MKNKIRAIGLALAAMMLFPLSISSPAHAASGNLAPNHDFEQSVLPDAVAHQPGVYNQPVLPVGWAFEGAAELFDYNARNPKHGQYSVQISGSWSVASPAGRAYYSTTPVWRTQMPVPVTAGTHYTFSAWMGLSIPLDGTGAFAEVRWTDANGAPLGSTSDGPSLVTANDGDATYQTFVNNSVNGHGFKDESTADWVFKSGTVTAPSGAAGAILLLGYTDSAWLGSVMFDEVCFAKVSDNTCTLSYR